jgi:STE24 endopeptidase
MHHRTRILPACALMLLAIGSGRLISAQEPPASASVSDNPVVASAAAEQGPVAVPEASAKALSYYRSGNVLWIVGTLWGLIVPAALLFTGFSARMRNLAQRVGRKWLFVVVVYTMLFTLVSFVLDLPLSYYTEFVRQHAYGLSNQTLAKWVGDTLKSLMISLVMMSIVLPGIYFFLKS